MAVQTTYLDEGAKGYEGAIASLEASTNLISRTVETAAIGFGKAVKQGTADRGVEAADGASDNVIGITVRDQSVAIPDGGSADEFAVDDEARVMTKGVLWVTAYDAVAAGAAVYVAVNNSSDKFTDTTTSNLAIPGAKFVDSGAADDLVRIRLG